MKHPIPDSALDDRLGFLGMTGSGSAALAELERALRTLFGAGELIISKNERLPFWVILRGWRQLRPERDGCLVFVGRNGNRFGHRRIEYQHRPFYVHRIAYALKWGPIPDDLVVRHRCDNPPCVNPHHLIVGTQLDNVADAIARGRNSPPPILRGMKNPHAVLTDVEVATLRTAAAVPGAKHRDIAKAFGVSPSTVWRLKHGKVRNEEAHNV